MAPQKRENVKMGSSASLFNSNQKPFVFATPYPSPPHHPKVISIDSKINFSHFECNTLFSNYRKLCVTNDWLFILIVEIDVMFYSVLCICMAYCIHAILCTTLYIKDISQWQITTRCLLYVYPHFEGCTETLNCLLILYNATTVFHCTINLQS